MTLKGTCNHLVLFRKICKSFVDQNFEKLVEKLSQNVDADRICMSINACFAIDRICK